MKKVVLAMALMSLSTFAYSQEKKEKKENVEVPAVVEKAFQKAFPNTRAEWEDENGKFEGSFKYKGQEMSVVYDAQGTLEEKETEIKAAQLPAAASSYIAKNKLGKIKEAAKITKVKNHHVLYHGGKTSTDTSSTGLVHNPLRALHDIYI